MQRRQIWVGLGDNRIINGDMRIDQRNNGASGSASGYTVDRWQYAATQTAKVTLGAEVLAGSAAVSVLFGVSIVVGLHAADQRLFCVFSAH